MFLCSGPTLLYVVKSVSLSVDWSVGQFAEKSLDKILPYSEEVRLSIYWWENSKPLFQYNPLSLKPKIMRGKISINILKNKVHHLFRSQLQLKNSTVIHEFTWHQWSNTTFDKPKVEMESLIQTPPGKVSKKQDWLVYPK